MTWDVSIGRLAERKLGTLPISLRKRIIAAIDRLEGGPYQEDIDIAPLAGRPEWRLRVGGWRVLFWVYEDEAKIVVVSVSPRGDAYK